MQSQFPEPRQFQVEAHAALRKGFQNGHRCQVLMAPTGGGKTMLAMLLIKGALDKGKRSLFVCDRTTLIDQTSSVADAYGLSKHGVIQADHWRRNDEPFQICSAQTLARRGWPQADIVVIDECHCLYSTWTKHIPSISAAVIGLSATPFADGLGDLFSNLVNAATMDRLVREGILVPLRIFSCTPADMKGAETSGGEWTDRAAGERGLKIVGDVVSEWCKLGENRKTICFGATIAHCEELVRQFGEVGVNARLYTSETRPRERAEILQEYRKHDSQIRVLVSVEALAKGFDVPDVSALIDCRPLRKSLSTAMQMWGRGMRCSPATGKQDCLLLDHCIASGQRVLTHRGLIPIEEILPDDKLWDGQYYRSHRGLVSRGFKPVITYAGLTATADHPVKTNEGWRTLGYCAEKQVAIVTTGIGGKAVRECSGYFTTDYMARSGDEAIPACVGRMHNVQVSINYKPYESGRRKNERMSRLQSAQAISYVALLASERDEAKMYESKREKMERLWRSGDRVPIHERDSSMSMDSRQPWFAGRVQESGIGSNRQQRSLRSRKPSLVITKAEHEQHASIKGGNCVSSVQTNSSRNPVFRRFFEGIPFSGDELSSHNREVPQTVCETEREVWDILDCGPNNSFTCEGLLVHNSGNICRFARDFEDIYFNGLSELKMGQKLDKTIRRDEEDKTDPKGCPRCGHKPFYKHCTQCGYQRPAVSNLETEAGIMREITIGSRKLADDHRHLWEQLCTYARKHSAPEKQSGRAYHLFREIAGVAPPREWRIETTPDVPILHATANKIRSRNIAFIKSRR